MRRNPITTGRWIEFEPSAANPVQPGDQCRFEPLPDSQWQPARHFGLTQALPGVIYRRWVSF